MHSLCKTITILNIEVCMEPSMSIDVGCNPLGIEHILEGHTEEGILFYHFHNVYTEELKRNFTALWENYIQIVKRCISENNHLLKSLYAE